MAATHMGASKHTGGIQTNGGYPNIWGHPNIWVVSKHGDIKTYRVRGCPYASKHLDAPVCWDAPMFGWPPVCLDTPYVWMLPVCLDAPCMLGHPLYVRMMFGCPLYIHNTKKACFVRLRRCPYAPYIWMPPLHKQYKESMLCQTKGVSICPHLFGCPICLDDLLYV